MHKTRNLFGAKMAQKGFRVSVFALFLCASCYRIFILQQPLLLSNLREWGRFLRESLCLSPDSYVII